MFRLVFVSVVVALYAYLGSRLTQFDDLATWAKYSIWLWLFLVFAFFLILPFYFWHPHEKETSRRLKRMMRFSHRVLAYLNFLLPVVLIRDFVGLVFGVVMGSDLCGLYSADASAVLLFLPFVFKAWGGLTIARGPQVLRREISDPHLPEEFSGLRVLQVSDLHISHFLKKGFVESVVAATEKLKPDVVVLTGDIVDGPAEEHSEDIAKLRGLQSRFGVFFVPGNHECYWGLPSIEKALAEVGIVSLKNSVSSLRGKKGSVLIAGVPDPAGRHFGEEGPRWDVFESQFADDQFRILLSHQPSLADQAAGKGFHFQLSGHTHGGQFFPWNLLIGFFQKYPKGLFRIQDMQLYVNQGTGYWGPALRVGTHCELTEIVLRSG